MKNQTHAMNKNDLIWLFKIKIFELKFKGIYHKINNWINPNSCNKIKYLIKIIANYYL